MIPRLLNLPDSQSLFLFGMRGTGKSTLIEQRFDHQKSLWINLLDPEVEDSFARHPMRLETMVSNMQPTQQYVVIDEIQKIPKLLDVVHYLIEKTDKQFIMTGSSARKLKLGAANLLAGRAFVYHLFPFSFLELGNKFDLDQALNWGMLPKIYSLNSSEEYLRFLQSYSTTYLKEEIWGEQIVRRLDPFRKFLEVAAQSNGKIINYSNIAQDVGVDDKTIKEYFSILEDTLVGFLLEPFHHSFRKRLRTQPKFYFYDVGITRALARWLTLPLQPRTSVYDETFEHFIILECIKLASYFHPEYRFSYLTTKEGAEVDLIVDRPGLLPLFIEIKSSTQINPETVSSFNKIIKDFKDCEAICLCQDQYVQKIDQVMIYPWQDGIKKYFTI